MLHVNTTRNRLEKEKAEPVAKSSSDSTLNMFLTPGEYIAFHYSNNEMNSIVQKKIKQY
jgi:hypothetical protein